MKEFFIYLSCTWQLIRFSLFQSHFILARPPAPVYSFIFTPGLCCYQHGSVLALGSENMPVQASTRC